MKACPFIATVVVGADYKTRFTGAIQKTLGHLVEAVKRPDFANGFVLRAKQ